MWVIVQDILDAALLGLGDESANLIADRAMQPPFEGFRWPGFQGGIGSGGPITDGAGVSAAGLRLMVLQSGLSGEGKEKTILVLPSWPCIDWAVSFKLHAPFSTIVKGRYDGNYSLLDLEVTPKERSIDLAFGPCVNKVEWKVE